MTDFKKPPVGLFVTGTDTEIGKTYVASLIAKSLVRAGHRVGVYKAAASDCASDGNTLVSEDAIALWQSAGCPLTLDDVCPQRFRAAMAPHLAAEAEGKQVDSELLRTGLSRWVDHCDIVIVEGSGGLMSPVSDSEFVADLALDFGYPLIVVAPNELGVINHTLMTLVTATCFRDGLHVAGVVLNDSNTMPDDVSIYSNRQQISQRATCPVLAHVSNEAQDFAESVDWYALACQPPADGAGSSSPLRSGD